MSKCISLRLKIGSQAVKKIPSARCSTLLQRVSSIKSSCTRFFISAFVQRFIYRNWPDEPPCATTSRKRRPPQTASSLLFFFAKLLCKKPKNASNDKRGRLSRLVPIPYCKITSWFAIVLAEMRTERILRDKGDWKQSTTSRERPQHQNFLLVRRWDYTS